MVLIGQAVLETKIFEIVDGGQTDDDRRTRDHGHPTSSPCEPKGSGELTTIFEFANTHEPQRDKMYLRTFCHY